MDYERWLKDIASDNRSGSQAITRGAAELVIKLLEENPLMPVAAQRARILDTGQGLLRAHPTMASLFNLFDRLLQALVPAPNPQFLSAALRAAARDFTAEMDSHNRQVADHFFSLINPIRSTPVILTHSASGAVSAALRQCWERGKKFSVITTESRPMCEGALQAADLARAGIPTSLITDALAGSFLNEASPGKPQADLLIVGADAISAAGVVNKSGTFGLAVIARGRGVPCYVLAGSEKFLPPSYPIARFVDEEREPTEITSPLPGGLRVINRYFDLTPLAELSGIISEEGPLTPGALRKRLAALKSHTGSRFTPTK